MLKSTSNTDLLEAKPTPKCCWIRRAGLQEDILGRMQGQPVTSARCYALILNPGHTVSTPGSGTALFSRKTEVLAGLSSSAWSCLEQVRDLALMETT